jgi:hypothetical protein
MTLTDEQIGTELRALRPTPEAAFAAALDGRAAAGFPKARRTAAGRELTWGRLLPVLGGLAAVAVLVVVISSSGGGGSYTPTGGSGNAGIQGIQDRGLSGGGAAGQSKSEALPQTAQGGTVVPPIEPVPPIGGRPHNGQPQVQEQSASLGLSTDPDKLQDAADGVVQVTQRYDGFVDSSSVHAGSHGHASFSLRIPTAHLDDAMADLSDLGHVTSSDLGTTNITGTYADAGKAYEQARVKVASLLAQLHNASSQAEISAIKAKLGPARDLLAAARAALRGLKQRVALTPVSVEIAAHGDSGGWTIGDAADDAVNVLEAIGGALLIGLAVLVPLAALIALAWLGARELQRRRREAPLDR